VNRTKYAIKRDENGRIYHLKDRISGGVGTKPKEGRVNRMSRTVTRRKKFRIQITKRNKQEQARRRI